jgi:nucleotide-binding universal stress UspA family protein
MILRGSPAETLADTAERLGFEVVVVGSRGRGTVARMLLGSVADRLVHICKKPVIVAR